MLFMARNTLQTTTDENLTYTDSLLIEIHQSQFFPKNSHLDTCPTINCMKCDKQPQHKEIHLKV